LTLADGRVMRAPLVVAADSRISSLRRLAGIGAAMRDFGRSVLVAPVAPCGRIVASRGNASATATPSRCCHWRAYTSRDVLYPTRWNTFYCESHCKAAAPSSRPVAGSYRLASRACSASKVRRRCAALTVAPATPAPGDDPPGTGSFGAAVAPPVPGSPPAPPPQAASPEVLHAAAQRIQSRRERSCGRAFTTPPETAT
jgi:hypothetical protein